MDKNQIIILAVTLVAVAIRLYMKYMKKNKVNQGTDKNISSNSFPKGSGNDEYEPYSKK